MGFIKDGSNESTQQLVKVELENINAALTALDVNISSDFMLDVQRGLKTGISTFTVLGHSSTLNTGNTPETIWMKGGLYHNPNGLYGEPVHTGWIPAASTLSIKSTSVNDTSAGTGAQKITVVGLDTNRLEISETVIMNGTTDVVTSQLFLRVNMMFVPENSVGSLETNDGDITLWETGTTLNVMSYLEASHSYAQSAIWSVPSDETWYMIGIDGYLYDTTNAGNIAVVSFNEKRGGVFSKYLEFAVGTQGSTAQVNVDDRFIMPSGSDWVMRAIEVSNNGAIATFNGVLLRVKNNI